MDRLDKLKNTISYDCGCFTCKGLRQLIAVAEAAKADHWGGHFAKCPYQECPVCDAIGEVG